MRFMLLVTLSFALTFCLTAEARQFKCGAGDILIEIDLDRQVVGLFDGQSVNHIPEIGFPQGTWHWFKGLGTYGMMYEVSFLEENHSQTSFAITQYHKTESQNISCKLVRREDFEIL